MESRRDEGTSRWRRRERKRWLLGSAAGLLAALAAVGTSAPRASAGLVPTQRVIVTTDLPGAAGNLVNSVLGKVVVDLPLVNGVLADVPSPLVNTLDALPGVDVSADAVVDVAGTPAAAPAHAPSAVFPRATGADELTASGIDGRGVGVAVVDTGITKLPDFAGRVIGGVDLSGEGNAYKDSYGHGTFVAGLVAGNGASSNGAYAGEAPNANLVAVKVAGKSGQTNASTVILGLQWILANQKAMAIKVANLSLGVKVTRSSRREPLDLAVERAWQQGLLIVTSAGNSGPSNGTVTMPGDDPLVITVGASDDQGTATTADDTMSTFSSAGPTSVDGWVKPDLVAPGRSVVSLRAPGSAIDTANPTARIGTANFVGSGTSFSAAITSGA